MSSDCGLQIGSVFCEKEPSAYFYALDHADPSTCQHLLYLGFCSFGRGPQWKSTPSLPAQAPNSFQKVMFMISEEG